MKNNSIEVYKMLGTLGTLGTKKSGFSVPKK